MNEKRPHYPDALIFDVWWIQADSFDPPDDEPDAVQVVVDEAEDRDQVLEEDRRSLEGYWGPWD